MSRTQAHTARVSAITATWQRVQPLVPRSARLGIRRYGQFLHGRHLSKTDRLLLSYPKSGSTWLRTMLAFIQSAGKAGAADLASWVPPLHMVKDQSLCLPRVVRSHDPLKTPGFNRAGNVLILVRDPRALVVSFSRHEVRRGRNVSFMQAAEQLVSNGFFEIGSWGEHARAVLAQKSDEGVQWVKYEDLRLDSSKWLEFILVHFQIEFDHKCLVSAIEFAKPERMQQSRKLAGLESGDLSESDVRQASTQKWREECPEQVQQYLLDHLGAEMQAFGYEC